MVHLPAPMLAASLAWYAALLLAPGVAGSRRRARCGPPAAHRTRHCRRGLARPHRPYAPGDLPRRGQATPIRSSCPTGPRVLVDGGPAGRAGSTWASACSRRFSGIGPIGHLDVVASPLGRRSLGRAGRGLSRFRCASSGRAAGAHPSGRSTRVAALARARVPGARSPPVADLLGHALLTVLGRRRGRRCRHDESLGWRLDWARRVPLLPGRPGRARRGASSGARAAAPDARCQVAHHGSRSLDRRRRFWRRRGRGSR